MDDIEVFASTFQSDGDGDASPWEVPALLQVRSYEEYASRFAGQSFDGGLHRFHSAESGPPLHQARPNSERRRAMGRLASSKSRDPRGKRGGDAARTDCRRFNSFFKGFSIRIEPEEVVLGARGQIGAGGWRITYRVDPDDGGFPSLEFYATHRMTDDSHYRIWADGYAEKLEALRTFYGYRPEVPESKEEAERKYTEHNVRVAKELRERGLYQEGDINAYLRTRGVGSDTADGSTSS